MYSSRFAFVLLLLPLFLAPLAVFPQLAAAQSIPVQPRITQPVDGSQLTVLHGNVHPLARAQFDRGAAPADLPMNRILLVLQRSQEQETALRTLLDNQQDKASPSYHKWLTPEQFGQQFGPADQDLQTVTAWLQSQGFQVTQASQGRTVIEFSGTAGQVQQAFHTAIHAYVVNGEQHWANATDPSIPTALAPVVAGIASLNNFPRKAQSQFAGIYRKAAKEARATPISPQFTFPGGCDENNNCYALGPYDFATIYNVLPLWNRGVNGTGQTIAIVGRTNINIQDVRDFRSLFGLPANDPQIILNGPDPGINGDEGEADIDVQWSGAVAPGATIDFVTSESTETTDGVDLSALYIVDNNLAAVMSESYGLCELDLGTAGNQFYNQLWEQAAAQGITVFISSGDSGSAGCDVNQGIVPQPAMYGLAVNGLASTPYNVAVGGTDLDDFTNPPMYWNAANDPTTHASAKSYIPEVTWNDSCANSLLGTVGYSTDPETNCNDSRLADLLLTVGGSGGASNCITNSLNPGSCTGGYPKPSWQAGIGVPNDGARDLPDVSLFASNGFLGHFYIVCQRDSNSSGTCNLNAPYFDFAGYGGTSVAAPAFAGIMALVSQAANSRQGNANYVLYQLAARQTPADCNASSGSGSSCVFNDITSDTIAVPCQTNSPNCTTVTPSDLYGVLSGYTTTAGYDLATGLGSVNAANLVSNWNLTAFAPSVTTLTSLSPVTITHGQTVSISVTVASQSGTGTPTGAVSLIGGSNNADLGIGSQALANGIATWSTQLLPGGSYNVTAHYAGDGTFAASNSSPAAVTVNKENSTIVTALITLDPDGNILSSNAGSAAYGSPYRLRISVTGTTCSSNSNGQAGCPTGTVTVTDNGAPLDAGTYSLNSLGYAEDQTIQLAVGSHAIRSSYGGDDSFNAGSTAGADNITITKAATTLTVVPNSSQISAGASLSFAVTLNTASFSNLGPSGTLNLYSGAALLASTPVASTVDPKTGYQLATWNPMVSASLLSDGANSITAQYTGDSDYAGSTSAPVSVSVQPDFSFAAGAPSLVLTQGQSGTVMLTVTALAGYTGTVDFTGASCSGLPSKSSCSFSPASITGSGSTTLTISTVATQTAMLEPNRALYFAALLLTSGTFVGGMLVVGGPTRRRRWSALLGLVIVACLATGVGCGGGSAAGKSTIPGTSKGTYPITVTATSGSLTHTASFQLMVQ
jgi:subtilase family serine protease